MHIYMDGRRRAKPAAVRRPERCVLKWKFARRFRAVCVCDRNDRRATRPSSTTETRRGPNLTDGASADGVLRARYTALLYTRFEMLLITQALITTLTTTSHILCGDSCYSQRIQ